MKSIIIIFPQSTLTRSFFIGNSEKFVLIAPNNEVQREFVGHVHVVNGVKKYDEVRTFYFISLTLARTT